MPCGKGRFGLSICSRMCGSNVVKRWVCNKFACWWIWVDSSGVVRCSFGVWEWVRVAVGDDVTVAGANCEGAEVEDAGDGSVKYWRAWRG